MNRKGPWIALGVLLLGVLVIGVSALMAQRGPFGPVGGGEVGRYQLVTVTNIGDIILLDTSTGDLYRASSRDLKEYDERPRVRGPRDGFGPPPRDDGKKDGFPPFRDRKRGDRPDFDKGGDKDRPEFEKGKVTDGDLDFLKDRPNRKTDAPRGK